MTIPVKLKKLKRKSSKNTLGSSKKKKKKTSVLNPENEKSIVESNALDADLSAMELTSQLEKQYEIEKEKIELVNKNNVSQAVLKISESMIPFFQEIKKYQKMAKQKLAKQKHELDSPSLKILKNFQQYVNYLFKTEHDIELILNNLEKTDALNESPEKIIHYLKIINKINKTDSYDALEHFCLTNEVADFPEITQPILLENIINAWEENKKSITNDEAILQATSTDLLNTYDTIKKQKKIINDLDFLINKNELQLAIDETSNLLKKSKNTGIHNFFKELHHALIQFQPALTNLINTILDSSYYHNPKALNKISQLYENTINVNQLFEKHYTEIPLILLHPEQKESMVNVLEKIDVVIKKSIFIFEEIITNPNAKPAFEKKMESGTIFAINESIKDQEFLKSLSLGVLSDFTPSKAMQMALEGLSFCKDPKDIKNSLSFIYYLLIYDSQNVSIDYTTNTDDFLNHVSNNIKKRDEDIIQNEKKIALLVTDKKEKHQKEHELLLSNLSADDQEKISIQSFSRKILQYLYHLKNSELTVKNMLCIEFEDLINSAHPNYFSSENKNLESPYFSGLLFIQEAKAHNINLHDVYLTINKKNALSNKIHVPVEEVTVEPMSKFSALITNIEKMAKQELNTHQEKILSKNLLSLIEKTYNQLLKKIQTHELAAAGKQIDKRNIDNGIYMPPQSIHINKLQNTQEKISSLLELTILNTYENNKISLRHKVKECRKITDFYLNLMVQAFQSKQFYAFSVLFKTLNKNHIKKFITNTEWQKQYQQFFIPDDSKFFELLHTHHSNPSVDYFLNIFTQMQTEMSFNPVAKYLTIGQESAKFETEKNVISDDNVSSSKSLDISDFADTYIFNCNAAFCEVSYLTLSVKLNAEKFQEYAIQRSNKILPSLQPEKKSLINFNDISELYFHLSVSHDREWGYNLLEADPQKQITEFIIEKISNAIEKHDIIPNIQDIFSILKKINDIEISLGNQTKEPYRLYKNIFDLYSNILEKNKKSLKPETLKNLENSLMQSKDFLQIIDSPPQWFDFFKEKTACYKSAINLEDKLYDLIQLIEPEPIKEDSSSFIGLLNSILDDAPLTIFSEQNKNATNANFSAVMSAREYWITPYDPEYVEPSQIFLSLSQSHQSTLSKFSDESLQNQFVNALLWSKSLSEIKSVSSIKPVKNPNLINTEIPLENDTQLSVIKYLLISFDLLGKLCGQDGVLALKNYDVIDKLINKIDKLQSDLSGEYCRHRNFKNALLEQIHMIQKQNHQLYLSSTKNSQGFFIINESMNNFCHLNEQIAHQLLDIPFNGSVLSPDHPSPPYDAQISKATLSFYSQKNKKSTLPQLKVATNPTSSKTRKAAR